jgi:pyruvate kinase
MDVVTTIGPASWEPNAMDAILQAGVAMIRFPFAKETPEVHARHHRTLRKAIAAGDFATTTIADLPGGKPRLNNAEPFHVDPAQQITIRLSADASGEGLAVNPPLDDAGLTPGGRVAIGDGENAFVIDEVAPGSLRGHFDRDGIIQQRRAFLPAGEDVMLPSLLPADRAFARTASECGFEWVALSFVSRSETVEDFRAWSADVLGWRPRVMAKVETAAGVRNAKAISATSDAVLVGRGDLALHMGIENLWHAQQRVIEACRETGTYVVVGTGFLESNVAGRPPSRSEAIDIAVTASAGTDAIMLASETTIGTAPAAAVRDVRRLANPYLP